MIKVENESGIRGEKIGSIKGKKDKKFVFTHIDPKKNGFYYAERCLDDDHFNGCWMKKKIVKFI